MEFNDFLSSFGRLFFFFFCVGMNRVSFVCATAETNLLSHVRIIHQNINMQAGIVSF